MTGTFVGEAGATGETTAFANAMIFDGSSAELREGCVRVAAGVIVEVGEGPGAGDRVVDCRGRTVVPGLIDAHFHAYGARLSLLERLRSGAHAVKIMASGGVLSPSDPLRVPQYSPEEIRAVAEEAARRGRYVAAHAYSAEAIAVAVASGVRSIEHGNLLDAPAAAVMAERGAFLVPTLVTYDAMERRGAELGLAAVARAKNREVLDAGRAAIGLAREAGVRIGFGTDLMGALDDEQLAGLRLQAEVEGPLALLRAATSVNAELLGRDDLGRIGSGAVADLLVLDGDPLRDPSVLWGGPDRRAVFQGGIRVAEHSARLVL